jgi:hypothetical protein
MQTKFPDVPTLHARTTCMAVQNASFCLTSQGTHRVFVCTFVHSRLFSLVFQIVIKSLFAETQPAALLSNREW